MNSRTHLEQELRRTVSQRHGSKVHVGMKRLFVALVRFYQWFIGPMFHTLVPIRTGCRFYPTCSEYMVETIKRDGAFHGVRKGLLRLSRCHPIRRRSTPMI